MVRPFDFALKLTASLAVLAAVWAFDGQPAQAQQTMAQAQPDVSGLSDRIDRLQRDVDVLQRQLARRGGAPAGSSGAPAAGGDAAPSSFIDQTQSHFDSIDDQMRELTNRLEEVTNQVNQLSAKLDRLSKDVDFRLNALEHGGQPGAAGAPPSQSGQNGAGQNTSPPQNLGQAQVAPGGKKLVLVPGPSGAAASEGGAAPANAPANGVELPQGSPEAQYEFAYGLLLQAQREQTDFSRPEQAFREFLKANPNHRLAGNANYWLGETYYARKDYQDAAATFAEGLKKYPKSEKAPDNLLKLGMTLAVLKRKNDACGALAQLSRLYPSAAPQVKNTATRERTRLGCQG